MTPRASRSIVLGAFAFAAALGLAACAEHAGGDARAAITAAERAPLPVTVARAREVDASSGHEVVGTVRSRSVAELSPSVMGTVRTLRVSLGSTVKAGEVLATLSAGEIEAQAERARAVFEQAELDLKRAQQLKATDSISSSAYDAAVAQFRVAEAARAEANVMRGYTTIRAPFAGAITQKLGDVGDLAVPGKPLLVLESPGALRLEAAVPEGIAAQLAVGTQTRVFVEALHEPIEAQVAEISPAADPSSRTLLVKVDLPADARLRAGMFGRLVVPTVTGRVVVVPEAAVVRRGQMELVFVADGDAARLRIIRTGRTAGGETRVLAGLRGGEVVITKNAEQLVDGARVRVQPEAGSAP